MIQGGFLPQGSVNGLEGFGRYRDVRRIFQGRRMEDQNVRVEGLEEVFGGTEEEPLD